MLIRKQPWTRQPQGPTRLKREHIRSSLDFAVTGAQTRFDAAQGRAINWTNASGAACMQFGTPYGLALSTPDNSWADYPVGVDWSGACSITMFVRINSLANPWGGLFAKRSSGSTVQLSVGRSDTTTNIYFGVNDDTTRDFSVVSTGSIVGVGFIPITIVYDGTNAYWYQSGKLIGDTSAGSLGSQNTGTASLLLGAERSGSNTYDSDADWLYFQWRRGVPSATEIASWHANLWGLFEPRRIWVPVSVGGGGGQTIAVPAGSLTLTGNAPTVLAPRTIAVPTGSLTLTGNAPTVLAPRTIAVPAGSLTLTGNAPTVLAPRTIAIPAGALSLTGYAPTVVSGGGQVIQVPAASLILTGNAPTVLAPRTIAVPTGSLTLTAFAPTVLTSRTIAVPSGTLTLTGLAPSVVATANKYISVPAGTLTLTGYAPTVTASGSTTIYFWKRTA